MPLAFEFCRAKPNWIPRNPKLMLNIWETVRRGLEAYPAPAEEPVVVLADINFI
jgi:hypothetical protein